jgi:biopolymer transport protein ExbB
MLQYILDGGLIMIPLMGLSVLALAVIIDRLRAFRLASVDTTTLREKVIECLEEGRLDDAGKACEEFAGPVAAVLLVGINKYRKLVSLGRAAVEIESNVTKTMADYAPHVIEALEKRLNLLVLTASVSPLLGMTGTVTGMIRSFNSMAAAGGLDAGAVAAGISEALITTAAGLLIAIPAVVFHAVLAKKIDRYVLAIEESAQELIDFITLEQART